MDNGKMWKCKNGHVLGVVQRVKVSSNGTKYHVSRLILFRQAVDLKEITSISLEEMDVIGSIEGIVLDIRCSMPGCGSRRTWYTGEASIEKFFESQMKDKIG